MKFITKTVKGTYKLVTRKHAKKILQNGGSVRQVGGRSNMQAKTLMREASGGERVVKHEGHKLKNGKTGRDHFQKKSGDGSHVFYGTSTAMMAVTTVPGADGIYNLGNAGKLILGDNEIGNFFDDWVNPGSDVKDLYFYLMDLVYDYLSESSEGETTQEQSGEGQEEQEQNQENKQQDDNDEETE